MKARGWALAGALAVLSLAIAGGAGSANRAQGADERALLKLERAWVAAETTHDAAALGTILDDRFMVTFGSGKPMGKAAFIKEVTDGPPDPTASQELSDRKVILAGDTAVIVETDTIRETTDGRTSTSTYRFTTTYIKRRGRWRALAEHGALAGA